MDEKLQNVIDRKIPEILSQSEEINQIVGALKDISSDESSFSKGIIVGRLYNSFYYQCRRILKRNPTKEEFSEFVDILKSKQNQLK